MKSVAILQIALHALRINLLRSSLAMLGIVIGVSAVIVLISVGAGTQERIERQIESFGSNLVVLRPAAAKSSGVRAAAGTSNNLTQDDAHAIAAEIAGVRVTAPILRGNAQLVAAGSNWEAAVNGVTPDYFEAREWPLLAGRLFEPAEVAGAAKVVVLGHTVAAELFGGIDPLGQTVRINHMPFTVIGVLEAKGQNAWGHDQDDIVMVPVSTARSRLFGNPQGKLRRVSAILVKIEDDASIDVVQEDIRALMRQRQRAQGDEKDGFSLQNLSEMVRAREESSRTMALLLTAVASISLLVGGIGIMNIMLVSVTERTREIGLRMAVGAKARDILAQFLAESASLSLLGGLLGIALGAGGAVMLNRFADLPTSLSPGVMALAAGVSAAIGIFFGFYPAHKASRMLPIQALRYE